MPEARSRITLFARAGAAACVLAGAAPAAQLTPQLPAGPVALEPAAVFAGPPGGFGALEVYDAASGGVLAGPAHLTDLRLLPLDFSGRTETETLLPERPRFVADLPGDATRLALPRGAGSLYRYQRATAGGMRYGFLMLRHGAFPRVLFERPGSGLLGEDPFVATIGVALDGSTLLVATVPAAGGDLFEVPLGRGAVTLRTASVPPQAFSPDGLWLGPDFGFGVAPSGVWRFARGPLAEASAVPAPAGTVWTGQAVMSRGRRFALATSGVDPAQRDAWVFGATGAAARASVASAELADAGFAPQHTSGPWLAVSDDGALAAWIETTRVTAPVPASWRDVRLERVQSPVAGPVVTGDPYLLDTLDEVARLTFFRPDALAFAAGEVNAPNEGGLDSADFFSASLDVNEAPVLRNLSLTSGDPSVPFTGGVPTLTPEVAYVLGDGRMVLHDGEAEELSVLDLATGAWQLIEADVKDLYWFEPVGTWFAANVRRRNGQRPIEVLRFARDFVGGSAALDPGSPSHAFLYPTVQGDTIAWIESILGAERVERARPATLSVETWSPTPGTSPPGTFTPPLVVTPNGDLRFARNAAGLGVESRTWRTGGAPDAVLLHPLRPGHWLP